MSHGSLHLPALSHTAVDFIFGVLTIGCLFLRVKDGHLVMEFYANWQELYKMEKEGCFSFLSYKSEKNFLAISHSSFCPMSKWLEISLMQTALEC